MKFLLAALLVFVGAAAQAATYYGFKIGGESVTSDNFNNVRSDHMSALNQNVNGGDYLVTYNPETNIVVLYNVNIERTGSGNRAILNESCEGLTVVLRRGNHLEARDASPVRLEASTTIIGDEVDGYKYATIKGGSEGGMTIANGATVTIRNIDLSFYNADPSYCINGVASSSTNPDDWATLIIENSKVNAKSEMVTDNWCICNLKHLTVNNSFVNLYGYEAIHNLQSFTKGEGMTTMLSKIHRAYFYAPDMNFSTRPNVSSPSNVVTLTMSMSDETGISINETTFPDLNFRTIILDEYDDNGDDLLSEREINQTKEVVVGNKGIANLKGLEYFTYLEKLYCGDNPLTSIDLSPFTRLKEINCPKCELTSLSVSHNKYIHKIVCDVNKLTTIDLADTLVNLKAIEMDYNNIRGAGMDALIYSLPQRQDAYLRVKTANSTNGNEMTQTQVLIAKSKGWTPYYWAPVEGSSNWSWLEYEGVSDGTNPSVVIDATNFPDAAFRAEVASDVVDLDQNGVLSEYELQRRSVLNVHGKDIASLQGIEHFTELQRLNCYDNNLTELDLTHNSGIRQVYLYGNNICGEAMDSFIASLPSRPSSDKGSLFVICDGRSPDNAMTSLQVEAASAKGWNTFRSTNDGQSWITYYGEDVGFAIDAQHFPDENLRAVILDKAIDTNEDGYLSVSERDAVTRLNFQNLNVESAKGIEYFPNLKELYCSGNNLTELDLHRNQKLLVVSCSKNKLTSWSFAYQQNRLLRYIYCCNNQLTQLNFSNNPALEEVYFYGNKIRGENMTVLVNSLHQYGGKLYAYKNEDPVEGNYMTYSQMVIAEGKHWRIYDSSPDYISVIISSSDLGLGIDEYNFPDEVFREYVEQFDTNHDEALSEEELSAVTTMNVIGNVADLTGIENFTALKRLEVQNQQLTKLDVSKLTELETLWCDNNQLTKLDLTNNTKLIHLQCTNNQLTELDLANTTTLVDLWCENNLLNQLDVANNTALVTLSCSNNQLKSLNVAQNEALADLRCDHNQLTTLDLSTNVNLETIECKNNQLTSILTAPGTPKISMNCWNNRLKGRTMTDLVNNLPTVESGVIYFRSLDDIEDNEMTSAQVNIATGKGWKIWQDYYYDYTDYWGNYVELAINATNFPDTNFRNFVRGSHIDKDGDGYLSTEEQQAVKTINVSGCYIGDLTGIQYFTNLEDLDCGYNQIESLNLQQNTKLKILNCSNNQLTQLTVVYSEGLEEVDCSNNQIETLNLYSSTLRSVDCYNNKLSEWPTGDFLASLPDLSSLPENQHGQLYFRCDFGDENEITTQQVQFAKQQGWTIYSTTGNHWYKYEGTHIKGDANGDGVVNIADAMAVVNYILNDGTVTGNFYFYAADTNNDYLITIEDVVAIVEMSLD